MNNVTGSGSHSLPHFPPPRVNVPNAQEVYVSLKNAVEVAGVVVVVVMEAVEVVGVEVMEVVEVVVVKVYLKGPLEAAEWNDRVETQDL